MKLTPRSLRLLATGLTLMLVGTLFGNMVLVYIGSMPLILVVLILTLGQVVEVTVEPVSDGRDLIIGDEVDVEREIDIRGGIGVVTLHQELPEHFRLVSGNNTRIIFKGFGDQHIHLGCRVECTRRGVYRFEKLDYQFRHVLGLLEPMSGSLKMDQLVAVRPSYPRMRKVRERRQVSLLPMPAESHIRMGVDTTDFREMRSYGFGDPYRKINWKATSRALTSSSLLPIVNEYEKEGRRVMYIFLNCAKSMATGNSLENGFEYGIQAALSLTQFYIDRQNVVGFSLYNEDQAFVPRENLSQRLKMIYQTRGPGAMADLMSDTQPAVEESVDEQEAYSEARKCSVFPEGGRRQLFKVRRLLQEVGLGTPTHNLSQSFQMALGNLRSTRPLLIFITCVRPETAGKMREDLILIRRDLRRTRDGRRNMFLLNVSCFGLSSRSEEDEQAARIAKIQEDDLLADRFGDFMTVVNWDPSETSLVEALSTQVKSR